MQYQLFVVPQVTEKGGRVPLDNCRLLTFMASL
jgi:hypothetical protein